MILVILLLVLMIGGLLAWLAGRLHSSASRWISLLALLADLVIISIFWIRHGNAGMLQPGNVWLADIQAEWIPQLGIGFHMAMDGISMVMLALTFFLGILSVLISWKHITKNPGFYYFNILWLLAGISGVFVAMDMVLFYFFWEVMLVPMYFIIAFWGHKQSRYAATKFFIFTQVSGLLMLIAIFGIFFIHGNATGVYTFDYFELLGTSFGGNVGFWLMCGFLIAFLVKLPAFPFHSWLPDAYSEAPAAGSIIIAALMSKTAAYGLIRFVIPFFPEAAQSFSFVGILLGVIGILYGAKMAFGQWNLKRLIAFSSFSHVGFILVGVFSFNLLAYQGVMMQMVAHALSIAGLFLIAAFIYQRTGNLNLNNMGGFWAGMPNMGGMTIVFVTASVGLPGLANFIAEFLVLAGVWQSHVVLSVLATVGLIVSVTYSLKLLQKIFHRTPVAEVQQWPDISPREWLLMGTLTVSIVWLGLFPQSVFRASGPAMEKLEMRSGNDATSATVLPDNPWLVSPLTTYYRQPLHHNNETGNNVNHEFVNTYFDFNQIITNTKAGGMP